MAGRHYVDSSAYLSVLLGEKGHRAMARKLERGEMLSSTLLLLEVERNLVRLAREGALSAEALGTARERLDKDAQVFSFRDLTPDLARLAAMPMVSTPRSLDLVHLRTAMWFHAQKPIDDFLTRDVRQRQAAREMGLPVRDRP